MTKFNLKDILKDVRIVLGHNDVSTSLTGIDEVDTLTLDDVIRREIRPGAIQTLLTAPKDRLEWHMLSALECNAKYVKGYNGWKADLPSDFLRMGYAKLKSWVMPLTEAVSVNDLLYKKQFSDYAGLRATTKKPVMAVAEGISDAVVKEYTIIPAGLFKTESEWTAEGVHDTGLSLQYKQGDKMKFAVDLSGFATQEQMDMKLVFGTTEILTINESKDATFIANVSSIGTPLYIKKGTEDLPQDGEGEIKVTITNETGVKNVLQLQLFGTSGASDGIEYVTCITNPKVYNEDNEEDKGEWDGSENWTIEYPATMYYPMIYQIASLVAMTLKDGDMSNALMQKASDMTVDIDGARREARLYGLNQQAQQQ